MAPRHNPGTPIGDAAREATAPPFHGTHRTGTVWCLGCGLPGHATSLDPTCPAYTGNYCRAHDLYDCPYAHG
jgi:hypothetical protein